MSQLKERPSFSDHFLGHLNAPVVLVEYGDYECPHSLKAHQWIKVLRCEFQKELCFIYRHYPLTQIHGHAMIAALAAESAAESNFFWDMHDELFKRYQIFSKKNIMGMAKKIGINESSFYRSMNETKLRERIQKDLMNGKESGISSTPAFFLNGLKLEGPISLEILRKNILNLLSGQRMTA
jgi:protein-disulfide isomerase